MYTILYDTYMYICIYIYIYVQFMQCYNMMLYTILSYYMPPLCIPVKWEAACGREDRGHPGRAQPQTVQK